MIFPPVSDGLYTVLPLLGVAGSVGHEVVVNVQAPVLGCEEPHVGHGLLHLQIFCPVTHWFVATRMPSSCAWETLWWEFESGTMVHLDVGALEQAHAGIVVSSIDIVKGSSKGFSILVEGNLRARALPQGLQVLLHPVLLLIVEMRFEFDQRLVLECGRKVVRVLLLRQLDETADDIALGEAGAVAFPAAVVELCPLSASHTVSKFVKAKRRLKVRILLSPSNPHCSTFRHLNHLYLKVPAAPCNRVGRSCGAVKLGSCHMLPVLGDGELRGTVVQSQQHSVWSENPAQEARDRLPCHLERLVKLLSEGCMRVRLGKHVAITVPVEWVLLWISIGGKRGSG